MQGKKTGSEGRITAAYFSAKRKKNVPLSIPGRSGYANRQMIRILRGIVQDPANDCLTDWAEKFLPETAACLWTTGGFSAMMFPNLSA